MLALAAQFDKDVLTNPHEDRVRCGFEVEFASRVSRQEVAWAMREFTGSTPIKVSNKYGASHGSKYTHWGVENDTSISTDSTYKTAVEIVSPTMGLDRLLDTLHDTFNLVDRLGQTNSSTGLHITFSLTDINLNKAKFDPLKLLLLLGEHYYALMFGRTNTSFAQNLLSSVAHAGARWATRTKHVVTYKDCLDVVQLFNTEGFGDLQSDLATDTGADGLARSLRRAITTAGRKASVNIENISSSNGSRVEFRLMGGVDYHFKYDKVSALIRRFAYALWASCSAESDLYNDVYARKLYRLLRDEAGQQANTMELAQSKVRLIPTESTKPYAPQMFLIEHLYKYKGQVGRPTSKEVPDVGSNILKDNVGEIGFDKKGKLSHLVVSHNEDKVVFEAFLHGKLVDPAGNALSIADYVYATMCLKSSEQEQREQVVAWVSGTLEGGIAPSGYIPQLDQLEHTLVRKYGKEGAQSVARIVASILTNDFLEWLRGVAVHRTLSNGSPVMQAVVSGDFSAIRKEYDIYLTYVKRYQKFMAAGLDLDIGKLNLKPTDYVARLTGGDSSTKYGGWGTFLTITKYNSLTSNALRPSDCDIVTPYAIQRAYGRDDLATASALRGLRDSNMATGLNQKIKDWSFLDKRVIKLCPAIQATEDVAASLSLAADKNSFAYQYLTKTTSEVSKAIFASYAQKYASKFITETESQAQDDWYAKTGIPSIDKASKAIFSLLLKGANKHSVVDILISADAHILSKQRLYSFITRATSKDVEEAFTNNQHRNALIRVFMSSLFVLLHTKAEIPNNQALASFMLSSQAKAYVAEHNWVIPRDFFGIDHIEYLKSLLTPELGTTFNYHLLPSLISSGVPADYLLFDPKVALWYASQRIVADSYDVKCFLEAAGVTKDGKVLRVVSSPLIYSMLKRNKKVALYPGNADCLTPGYKPARL